MFSSTLSYLTRRGCRSFMRLHIDGGAELPLTLKREGGSSDGSVSLYVHIPFCRTLCPYCSFNRYLYRDADATSYFQQLRHELGLYLSSGYTFHDVYFGGGTPTVQMDALLEFIGYLHRKLDVQSISLETNPADVNAENVRLLKEAGVQRYSIGVQSFDEGMLKKMGRASPHGERLLERIVQARGVFETVNIDLIYNLPFQTIESFHRDVEAFKSLDIEQVTFYPLMPSPGTATALERRFNKVDGGREKRFYDIVLGEMRACGYSPSTTWCFSRGQHIIDEYIIERDDYVGIGSGAVSFLNGVFYVNSFALERYGEFVSSDSFPVIGWRRLSGQEAMRYYLLTKLFGTRLDRQAFRSRFGVDVERGLWKEMAFLRLAGAFQQGSGVYRLTDSGMFYVSGMMREFFSSLNALREHCRKNRL
jgi:coproporphyrinogen III oxidase-like Fe-S oxidoreductase